MAKLKGKVAIVTGASRGIGKAIADLFAKEGAKVVCSARTLKEGEHPLEGSLETTVAGIKKAGGEAEAVTCDVSSEADCEKLVEETHKLYGPVDVLVNNAALTYFIPVKDFPPKRWMRSFAVNLHGPFMLSHLVLKDMIPRKSGSIVNISSGAAIGPGRGPYKTATVFRGGVCYGAEKAALERFTQGLAEEVYDDGHLSDVRIAVASRRDSRHGASPSGHGARRSHRRAGRMDGAIGAHPRDRTARQGDGTGDIQPAVAQAVRRDRKRRRHRIRSQRQRLQFDLIARSLQ